MPTEHTARSRRPGLPRPVVTMRGSVSRGIPLHDHDGERTRWKRFPATPKTPETPTPETSTPNPRPLNPQPPAPGPRVRDSGRDHAAVPGPSGGNHRMITAGNRTCGEPPLADTTPHSHSSAVIMQRFPAPRAEPLHDHGGQV